jgi:23S rRNA-/tRNA-specific pseudouridylate synthase
LLGIGQKLDQLQQLKNASTDLQPAQHVRTLCLSDGTKLPRLQLRLRGISVVMKPPNWEVDAKGRLSNSGLYLSNFMQQEHAHRISTILSLSDFEYGFIHRLDVPSSGLILTGTHFEGYALLQWQMHTYTIEREYSVLVSNLVPSTLRDINDAINDFLPGQSFVDQLQGRPAETHLKTLFHAMRYLRFSISVFGLVGIAIHTGRRHQIRVHLQWEGHPTVTDEKYSHRSIWCKS